MEKDLLPCLKVQPIPHFKENVNLVEVKGSNSTGKSRTKSSASVTPVGTPQKPIETLEEALGRISELEAKLKTVESRENTLKVKHAKKIDSLKTTWVVEVKKLEDKKSELNKKLRAKNKAMKKEKAEIEQFLAVLDRSRFE